MAYWNWLPQSHQLPFLQGVRKPGTKSLISFPVNRQIHLEASFILQSEGLLVLSMDRLMKCVQRLAFEDELREKRSTRQSTNSVSRYSRTIPIFDWVSRFRKITLSQHAQIGAATTMQDLLVTTRFIESQRPPNSLHAPAFTWHLASNCRYQLSDSQIGQAEELIKTLKRSVITAIQECTPQIRVVLTIHVPIYRGAAVSRPVEDCRQWHELIQREMTDAIAIRIRTNGIVCATDNDRFWEVDRKEL